jgi:hypothetical protein
VTENKPGFRAVTNFRAEISNSFLGRRSYISSVIVTIAGPMQIKARVDGLCHARQRFQ